MEEYRVNEAKLVQEYEAKLQAVTSDLETQRTELMTKLNSYDAQQSQIQMYERNIQGKIEEIQLLEKETAKLRLFIKEKELLISEKESTIFKLTDDLRTFQYKEQKESAQSVMVY